MPKTLNQVLGEALTKIMGERQLSANSLAPRAGVSPRTLANYMKGAQAKVLTGDQGKERSATLEVVERIAAALGLSPLHLLTDPTAPMTAGQRLAARFDRADLPIEEKLGLLGELMDLIEDRQRPQLGLEREASEPLQPATPAQPPTKKRKRGASHGA